MRLKGKVAIVTGAASGIGRAIALLFAKEGAQVVVADSDDKSGQEAVKAIKGQGSDALFTHLDVSSADDVRRMIRTTVRHFGRLTTLVYNAAYLKDFKAAVDTPEEEWDRSMSVT